LKSSKKKYFVYIDESGQDTKGKFFVVSILILEGSVNMVEDELERIEKESKKQNIKWSKANIKYRKQYIEKLQDLSLLKNTLFFKVFEENENKEYLKLTALATAEAMKKIIFSGLYKATVYIDGFNRKELDNFKRELRSLQVNNKKIRGVREDKNNILIRLSDAICGLIRQAKFKQDSWSKEILKNLKNKKIIMEI